MSRELSKQKFTLAVPKEFSFDENMKYLSRSTNECLFGIRSNRITRAVPVGRETFVIEVGADSEHALTIRLMGDAVPSDSERASIAAYVAEWFDLERDLQPFYAMAADDQLLQGPVTSFYGLRNMGIPDLFEAICWGIIGQQINLAFAYTLKRRLVETFGRYVDCNEERYWLFPSPEQIASLRVQDMDELRMTVKKCEYVIGVAQLIAEGKLTKELLLDAGGFKQAEKQLVAIRGIGPWTANYVLMRCLRMPSAFPIDDVGLHNSIKAVLGMDRKPTKEEILQLSAGWTNWESYATFYLWRVLY